MRNKKIRDKLEISNDVSEEVEEKLKEIEGLVDEIREIIGSSKGTDKKSEAGVNAKYTRGFAQVNLLKGVDLDELKKKDSND